MSKISRPRMRGISKTRTRKWIPFSSTRKIMFVRLPLVDGAKLMRIAGSLHGAAREEGACRAAHAFTAAKSFMTSARTTTSA